MWGVEGDHVFGFVSEGPVVDRYVCGWVCVERTSPTTLALCGDNVESERANDHVRHEYERPAGL